MRSRSLVWGRRLLVGTAVVGAGSYGAFHSWVRSYDPGVAGPERNVRVLVDDDGQLRDEALRMSSLRVAVRWVQLAIIYLPLILSYPLTSVHPSLYRCWQEWFLCAVQWSGPAFIKLAQWLATRRDLFDPEFRAYARATPPFPFRNTDTHAPLRTAFWDVFSTTLTPTRTSSP